MTIHDPKPEELEKETESEGTVEHAEASEETTAPDAPQEEKEGEPPTQPDEDAKPDA